MWNEYNEQQDYYDYQYKFPQQSYQNEAITFWHYEKQMFQNQLNNLSDQDCKCLINQTLQKFNNQKEIQREIIFFIATTARDHFQDIQSKIDSKFIIVERSINKVLQNQHIFDILYNSEFLKCLMENENCYFECQGLIWNEIFYQFSQIDQEFVKEIQKKFSVRIQKLCNKSYQQQYFGIYTEMDLYFRLHQFQMIITAIKNDAYTDEIDLYNIIQKIQIISKNIFLPFFNQELLTSEQCNILKEVFKKYILLMPSNQYFLILFLQKSFSKLFISNNFLISSFDEKSFGETMEDCIESLSINYQYLQKNQSQESKIKQQMARQIIQNSWLLIEAFEQSNFLIFKKKFFINENFNQYLNGFKALFSNQFGQNSLELFYCVSYQLKCKENYERLFLFYKVIVIPHITKAYFNQKFTNICYDILFFYCIGFSQIIQLEPQEQNQILQIENFVFLQKDLKDQQQKKNIELYFKLIQCISGLQQLDGLFNEHITYIQHKYDFLKGKRMKQHEIVNKFQNHLWKIGSNISNNFPYLLFQVQMPQNESIQMHTSQQFVGLTNLGNTCYMNSVIQVLFNTEDFKNKVLNISQNEEKLVQSHQVINNFQNQIVNLSCILELKKIFQGMDNKEVYTIDTTNFYNSTPQPFSTSKNQQDCNEFLIILLNQIEEYELKQIPYLQIFRKELFQFQIKNIILCNQCNKESSKFEEQDSLQIDLSNIYQNNPYYMLNLKMLIDEMFQKQEKLEGLNSYFCENCCNLSPSAYKKKQLQSFPKILFVQINRIQYNVNQGQKIKLMNQIIFPIQLSEQDFNKQSKQKVEYKLYAIIVHYGNDADFGHYTVIVKEKQSQHWYEISDSKVTLIGNIDNFDNYFKYIFYNQYYLFAKIFFHSLFTLLLKLIKLTNYNNYN